MRAEAARLLAAGVAGHVFPGAVARISVRTRDGVLEEATARAGRLTQTGAPVRDDSVYDLASLTKPIFATVCLRLLERRALSLDVRAEQFFADVKGTPGGSATLEQLLTHRSGMAAWGGLYLDVPHELGSTAARRWIFTEATRRADEGPKGRAVYSDLGYIVAAELVSRATGKDLAALLAQEVVSPLGLGPLDLFYPPALDSERRREFMRRVAPTERDDWRGRIVQGEVHDENCHALGGVSGHAGMFGTARGVCAFGRAFLDALKGRATAASTAEQPTSSSTSNSSTANAALPWLSQETAAMAVAPRAGGSLRLGWDGKAPSESAAGRRMSAEAFGHLGFTGTSIWCDPRRDLVIVLLTNRVHPSRANEKIKGFRPAFHDTLVALVDSL